MCICWNKESHFVFRVVFFAVFVLLFSFSFSSFLGFVFSSLDFALSFSSLGFALNIMSIFFFFCGTDSTPYASHDSSFPTINPLNVAISFAQPCSGPYSSSFRCGVSRISGMPRSASQFMI